MAAMSDERSSHVTTDLTDENARLEQRLTELEERLRTQKDECEEKLRVQKDEYEEKLRVQREESDERLRVQGETVDTLRAGMDMYGPFPFDDLPLELIALVSDLVDDVDDLACMSLVSHHVRNGVLLSRAWIVVEEIVAATDGDVEEQRSLLHDRRGCAEYACKNGLLRAVRALNLSRREVTRAGCVLVGRLEVLKYFHRMYVLTAEELRFPLRWAVFVGDLDMIRYLRDLGGVTLPRSTLTAVCKYGHLEMLKYLHTEVGFTAEDVRLLDMRPLSLAATSDRDTVVYLRTGFGLTQEDALLVRPETAHGNAVLLDVFDLEFE